MARLFHLLLGCVLLAAWLSLGQQIQLLIGSDGLLPLEPLVGELRANDVGWLRFPTLLRLAPGDAALETGIAIGVVLALLVVAGIGVRISLLLSALLYLSYTVACQTFTSFQWDNLLIECCVLAAWLPRRREAALPHWLMRLLLFKLYLESGIGKAQSHLGDWFDGSAMTFYYETAPLPAWPAWYAHQLPQGWHALESWGALGLESLGAFLILGPRACRLTAFAALTGFQLLNLATANYGFFVYLALALHVFLLDDRDCAWLDRVLPKRLRGAGLGFNGSGGRPSLADRLFAGAIPSATLRDAARRAAIALFAAGWIAASLLTASIHFVRSETIQRTLLPIEDWYRALRVANAYHLFGHVTRERIEPEFQTLDRGSWTAHPLRYKPGDPDQPPAFVAPHQPRVDFSLWFYGLSHRRGAPRYVSALLDKLCHDPSTIQALFPAPLPNQPQAVRIEFWRYHFTTSEGRRTNGNWWSRESVGKLRQIPCTQSEGSLGRAFGG